jgi:hypothetical protein
LLMQQQQQHLVLLSFQTSIFQSHTSFTKDRTNVIGEIWERVTAIKVSPANYDRTLMYPVLGRLGP